MSRAGRAEVIEIWNTTDPFVLAPTDPVIHLFKTVEWKTD